MLHSVIEVETAIKEDAVKPLIETTHIALNELPTEDAEKLKLILEVLYEQVEVVSSVIKKRSMELDATQTSIDDFNNKLNEVVESVRDVKTIVGNVTSAVTEIPIEVGILAVVKFIRLHTPIFLMIFFHLCI